MLLIQILLPVFDNAGRRIPLPEFQNVKKELTAEFKGLTAYSRSVAEGFWEKGKSTKRDDIVVYEVMARSAKKTWWRKYRKLLEKRFRQEVIVIRVQKVRLI